MAPSLLNSFRFFTNQTNYKNKLLLLFYNVIGISNESSCTSIEFHTNQVAHRLVSMPIELHISRDPLYLCEFIYVNFNFTFTNYCENRCIDCLFFLNR